MVLETRFVSLHIKSSLPFEMHLTGSGNACNPRVVHCLEACRVVHHTGAGDALACANLYNTRRLDLHSAYSLVGAARCNKSTGLGPYFLGIGNKVLRVLWEEMNTERRGGEYIESNEHTCYSSKDPSHQAYGNSERRWRHLINEKEEEKEKVGGERKEALLEPEKDVFLKKLKRLLFETLPVFFDAYAWPYDNPLKNRDMLEKFMNTYIHPVLKKTLHRFSNIRYIPIDASTYRKSISNQKGNADRADGIACTTNEEPYEISVTEGFKPYEVENSKEISDYVQNARAAKDML
ncbi:hypothetical protein G9A89_002508 [Geosiphon pyriformis]|nr:hypothetical protein G9A89_002508 [Geosiphon pyriformis]